LAHVSPQLLHNPLRSICRRERTSATGGATVILAWDGQYFDRAHSNVTVGNNPDTVTVGDNSTVAVGNG
jgi:hypothetical protein